MKRPWHAADSGTLARTRCELEAEFPGLRLAIENQRLVVAGTFPVLHDGVALDYFRIRVEVPDSFPTDLPLVYEVDGRIAWIADRHVEDSGKACLFVPDERWKHFPENGTLLEFFRGPVHAFFLSQHVFQETGSWPFNARPHGADGIVAYYAEEIGSDDMQTVAHYLDVLRMREIKGHLACPCGRGKKLRDCHLSQVQALRAKIRPEVAAGSWARVAKELEDRRAPSRRT